MIQRREKDIVNPKNTKVWKILTGKVGLGSYFTIF